MKKLILSFIFLSLIVSISAVNAYAIFSLSVTPRRGGQNIRFEQAQPGSLLRNEEVEVAVESDRTSPYRIYLTMNQPLTNESGNTIPQNAFIVFSPSTPLGMLKTQLENPVTMGQTLIYTSNNAGNSDSFILVFNVRVPAEQPGGIYHTQLSFTAEPVNAQNAFSPSTVTVDVRVELNPTFHMEIRNSKGGRELALGPITKDNPIAKETLIFEISSNIGTGYRLIQQMADPLVSADGVVLEDKVLSFSVAGGDNGSLTSGAAEQPLSSGQQILYTSNPNGQGDKLQVRYQAAPDPSEKAGLYTSALHFKVESNSPFVPGGILTVPAKLEIEPIFNLDVEIKEGVGIHFGTLKPGEDRQERQVFLAVHSNLHEPYLVSQIVSRKLTTSEGAVLPKESFVYYGDKTPTGAISTLSPSPVREGESVVFTSDKQGTPEKVTLHYNLSVPTEAKAGAYNSELRYSITTL